MIRASELTTSLLQSTARPRCWLPKRTSASLTAALARLPPGETIWSREGFPWWVFMAGRTQNFQTIVREGIIRVTGVRLDDLTSCMRVTTRERVRVVSVNRGRVRVTEV